VFTGKEDISLCLQCPTANQSQTRRKSSG